ncbi:MAG TPA: PEP-CTERM sorting domain-containing protein [Candidatus Acidoferrales bacterium]|jgi:hypothetical protein|nr:PEP-CTERM sorting domain-containing protein [Candidatus Acidoferrales bacterium]
MKIKVISILLLLATCFARSQGVLLVDQQSTNLVEGAAGLQSGQPMGQSFTPNLSMIDFVQLYLYDGDVLSHFGGTVFVNLHSNSISGGVISSTAPVFMADGFLGFTNFYFGSPVSLAPGSTYVLELVAQGGSDNFGSGVTDGSYTGGSIIYQGVAYPGESLWFQEGITAVPEPSSTILALVGGGAWFFARRRREK